MSKVAEEHKEGNHYFRNGELADAIQEYTKAIIHDSSRPTYYSNRAMCFYKLERYQETVGDSQRAVELDPGSFKGLYYLGLGQTELGRLTQATTNLSKAYELALASNSPSTPSIYQAILQLRQRKWDEEQRLARVSPLLAELKDLLKQKHDSAVEHARQSLSPEEVADEIDYLNREYESKLEDLSTVFSRADHKYEKKEVPEYLLDPISFNLFVDPVVSKSGQSFERSWLLQHLKTSSTDPFSRQPLKSSELIPNLQLKAAAEEFIKKEGNF